MKKKVFLLFISILLFGISNAQKQLVKVGDELVLQEKRIPLAEFDSLPPDVSAANVKFALDNPGKPFEVSRRDFKTWYNNGLMFQSGEISTTRTFVNQRFTAPIDNKIIKVNKVSYGTYIFIALALIGFYFIGTARIYHRSEISIFLTMLLVTGTGFVGGVFGVVVAVICAVIICIIQDMNSDGLVTYDRSLLNIDNTPFGETSRFELMNNIGVYLLFISLAWLAHVSFYAGTYNLLLYVFLGGVLLFSIGRIVRASKKSYYALSDLFYEKIGKAVTDIYNRGDNNDKSQHFFTIFLSPDKYSWTESECNTFARNQRSNGWNVTVLRKDNGFEFQVSPL